MVKIKQRHFLPHCSLDAVGSEVKNIVGVIVDCIIRSRQRKIKRCTKRTFVYGVGAKRQWCCEGGCK